MSMGSWSSDPDESKRCTSTRGQYHSQLVATANEPSAPVVMYGLFCQWPSYARGNCNTSVSGFPRPSYARTQPEAGPNGGLAIVFQPTTKLPSFQLASEALLLTPPVCGRCTTYNRSPRKP